MPKRSKAPDTCRLNLVIRGVEYGLRPVRPVPAGAACAWRLRRSDGTVHIVTECDDGVACDCADFQFRHGGRDRGCKHVRALRSLGLVERDGGGPESWPAWTDGTRYTTGR